MDCKPKGEISELNTAEITPVHAENRTKSGKKVSQSQIWIPTGFGNIFRTDPAEDHLFINTFFNEILIFYGIGSGDFTTQIELNDIPGEGVVDFLPLKNNLLLVYTRDNLVLIYEYSP
jgi:hypothetical protein